MLMAVTVSRISATVLRAMSNMMNTAMVNAFLELDGTSTNRRSCCWRGFHHDTQSFAAEACEMVGECAHT